MELFMKNFSRRAFLGTSLLSLPILAGQTSLAGEPTKANEPAWDKEADVVVLGCGAAGLMAACQAAAAGATVIVFDKGESPYHTSTRLNGGCFAACGSRIQKEHNVKDTPEDFAANINAYGDGMSLMEPVMTYAKNSGAAFDWLVDHGLAEGLWQPYNGHTIARTVRQKTYNGKDYIDVLVKESNRLGIPINHDCGLQAFIVDKENNRVLGVRCGNQKNSVLCKAKKAVILATGGITGSSEEVAKWSPALKDAVTIGGGSNDGEALRIAVRDLNAPITHMQYFAEYPYARAIGKGRGPQIRYQYFVDNGALLVNNKGKRFVDESLAPTLISPSLKTTEDGSMYLVMNPEIFDKAAAQYPIGALVSSPQWTREKWDKELKSGRVAVCADTLEEAAQKAGIDPKGLSQQVSQWNEMVKAGKDSLYNRKLNVAQLDKGPYIISKINLWVCLSMGGLRVNKNLNSIFWYI